MAKYYTGDLIFCKLSGFPPWPARIEAPTSGQDLAPNEYLVYFFGTYKTAVVPIADIVPFNDFKETYGKQQKSVLFNKAMLEIENNNIAQSRTREDRSPVCEIKSESVNEEIKEEKTNEEREKIIKKKDDTKKYKSPYKRKRAANLNEEPERSRSGRIIKRKKFSSESEISECSEDDSIEEIFNTYSDDSEQSESKLKSESEAEGKEKSQNENESDEGEASFMKKFEKFQEKKDFKDKSIVKSEFKELKEEEKKVQMNMHEQLLDEYKIISKLSEIDKRIKQGLCFSTLNIEASLHAMSELQNLSLNSTILKKNPNILYTLKKCRKFPRSVTVTEKADYLFNKFMKIYLSLDKDSSKDSERKNNNFEVNVCDQATKSIIAQELPIVVNGDTEEKLPKKNLIVNHKNVNGRNAPNDSETKNLVTVNNQHKDVNGGENIDEEMEGSNDKSTEPSAEVVALLSSSIAMMKSIASKKESMEDAFGSFVAHQIKTFSDPVMKDRVMSRIVTLIMDEKYE